MERRRPFQLLPIKRCHLAKCVFSISLALFLTAGMMNYHWYRANKILAHSSTDLRVLYQTTYDEWNRPRTRPKPHGAFPGADGQHTQNEVMDTGTVQTASEYDEDDDDEDNGDEDYDDEYLYDDEQETSTADIGYIPANKLNQPGIHSADTVTNPRIYVYDGTRKPRTPAPGNTRDVESDNSHTPGQISRKFSINERERHDGSGSLKTILFWNQLFRSEAYRFGLGQEPFHVHKCRKNTCRTIIDRALLPQADVVMFHGPNIRDFPPPLRLPHQLYAYVQLEPHVYLSNARLPAYRDAMNLTIAHRKDADIWLPYGRINRNPKPTARERVDPRERPRSIAWVVSHCNTTGRREMYVRELVKYIDVDIYGKCGPLTCSKDKNLGCYKMIQRKYRYVMALENNHCIDYATEKLYRALLFNVVPIVFGGGNYTELAPPHSVINIKDFPNPADLATYLKRLGENPEKYNEYFSWKDHFRIERRREKLMGKMFCQLCELIHKPRFVPKVYLDLQAWWLNGTCQPRTVHIMKRLNKW